MNIKEFLSVWDEVFSKARYVVYALLIMFVFYLVNVLILNYQNIGLVYSSSGLFGVISALPSFLIGFRYLLTSASFITLIFISIMIGILFSMIFYRTQKLKEASNEEEFFSSLGIFFGILAPGCAACGLGLLPLLGFGSVVLASFPLRGLEFSILAILILLFALFKITQDIHKGIVCELPPVPKKKDGRKQKQEIKGKENNER